MWNGFRQVQSRQRRPQATIAAHATHLGLAADPYRVIEPERAHLVPKGCAAAVGAVGENDLSRYLGPFRALDHCDRQLDLGLEDHLLWNSRLDSALGVVGPLL